MDETNIIDDGIKLGYEGKDLQKYVDERCKRQLKIITDKSEREERRLKREADLEAKKASDALEAKRLELELARINASNVNSSEIVEGGRKANIKLTPYKPGEDMAVYLRTFDRVKSANEWSDKVAMSALINGFVGTKVSLFVDNLPPDTTLDSMKEQIIRAFGLNIYDYQNKFRFSRQSEDESFSQFVLRLKENLLKMCNMCSVEKDFVKFEEMVIKDQLLRCIDKNLAEFLKERDIFQMSFDDVVKISENFQAVHGKTTQNNRKPLAAAFNTNMVSERGCFSCGKSGHTFKDCPSKINNDGEKFKNNNVNVNTKLVRNSNSSTVRSCYNCKSVDHLVKDCPHKIYKNRVATNSDTVEINFTLNSKQSNNLPVTFGKCNNKPARVLRDTGSTAVLVKTSFVKPSFFTGKSINLKFADGRVKVAPKAKIYLKCGYLNGFVEAACLDELPFDVLVGNVPGASCACSKSNCDDVFADNSQDSSFVCAVVTRNQAKLDNQPPLEFRAGFDSVKLDMTNLSAANLIDMQLNDESLRRCFKKTAQVSETYPKFVKINDVLVRLANSSNNIKDLLNQIVLPKELRVKVMKLAHDTVMSGHLGVGKTQSRVLNHFYWPGVYDDIRRFCRSCGVCQKNAITKPAKVPLINLPVINKPFERVAVDIIGPLCKSAKGHRFALVSIDLATKYPDAVPLKRIDAYSVAEALFEIYSRVGLPSEILHDQGSQFMSSVMRKFNELLQIKSINTTPYNPKCNGSCENFNKTFKQMIKKISDDEPETWDKFLQPLLFAYREVPQCSTGFSPFELLFGHQVRGPLFLIKEKWLNNCTDSDEIEVTSYVMRMRDKIRDYMNMANKNEYESKLKEKQYYDKNCRKRNFKMGDKVLLLLPTSANKLLAEWKGPFDVVRRLNKVDYVIRIEDRERTYHINMLKPFYERVNFVCCSSDEVEMTVSRPYDISVDLSHEQSERMSSFLAGKDHIFSSVPGQIKDISYTIDIDPNVKPISSLPYKVPFKLKDGTKSEIGRWFDNGLIRDSVSSWASPMVVVHNADGSIRPTIDFRKINPHVNVDNFPMPDRDSVIERCANAKFLTKLDLTKAYFQIPLSEESRKYTSFVTEFGQYEFCVVPFGIKFASGLCNRLIKGLLLGCDDFLTTFVDDLLVFSDNFEDHMNHIAVVLDKLNAAGITLNVKKCKFAYTHLKFLGFIVGCGCIYPDKDKVKAIRNFPVPENKKHLRSFVGLLGFYRKFVPNLSSCISPLTDLLRKDKPDKISWNNDLLLCFERATNLVCEDLVLTIPRSDTMFVLQTDASGEGLGAVLGQEINGEYFPVSFISRKLSKAEVNYSVIELECLAIKWAIEYFHSYLYGGKFIVRTDHAPLTWLSQHKNMNSRLMRWALSLQTYDFIIEYVKGCENFLADMLSRYPIS